MAKAHERRLQALERAAGQGKQLGWRMFHQSWDDPNVYYAGTRGQAERQAYTMSEIDAMSAAGWRCIVVRYGSGESSQAAGSIHLQWENEPSSALQARL